METQLVRLDAPYNLICNKETKFGLHIATLIDIDPFEDNYNRMSYMYCYPVVERKNEPGGEIWNDCELETCKVICREEENISLRTIKEIMEYYYGWAYLPTNNFVWDLKKTLVSNGIRLILPKTNLIKKNESVENIISEYEVELIFEEDDEGCSIYSSDNSYFFFLGSIDYHPEKRAHPRDNDEESNILEFALLRDAYLMAFHEEGIEKITFYTKSEKYQEFVNKLNDFHDFDDVLYIKTYLEERCGGIFNLKTFELTENINEYDYEKYKKKLREQLYTYLSNSVGKMHNNREDYDKKPSRIFHDNLNVETIKTKLAKFNRNGCGPKQFCLLAKDFFASIGWLPVQIDTYFVSWMKYNNIVDMKDKGLTHVYVDDEKANTIKDQLRNTFQFENDNGKWEDRNEFYLPNRKKVNNGD